MHRRFSANCSEKGNRGTQTSGSTEWVYKVMTNNLSVFIAKVNADCHQVSHSKFYLWFTSKTGSDACLFVLFCFFDIEKKNS